MRLEYSTDPSGSGDVIFSGRIAKAEVLNERMAQLIGHEIVTAAAEMVIKEMGAEILAKIDPTAIAKSRDRASGGADCRKDFNQMKPLRNYKRKRRNRIARRTWRLNEINRLTKKHIFPIWFEMMEAEAARTRRFMDYLKRRGAYTEAV